MADQKEKIERLLTHNVEEVIDRGHLRAALQSGKKLRVKLGIDPTSPDLHLGHAVVLGKLREFQDLGHAIVLVIGDFTAQIGDPSGRDKTRPPLSEADAKKNLKHYLAQANKVIDVKKAEVVYNSKWLGKLNGKKMLELLSNVTLQQLIEREDFKKRLGANHSIRMHELLYPIMQAYDSVAIDADVELGGTEQMFNLLMGRDLMEKMGMKPQDMMTMTLLVGTDGSRKMSKSLGNYIGLDDEPGDMFGKVMSIPDAAMHQYFLLCAGWGADEIKQLEREHNPRNRKARLALEIVKRYHGEKAARKAQEDFEKVFSKKDFKDVELPVVDVPNEIDLVDLVVLCFEKIEIKKSKSEARRLIVQRSVKVDQGAVLDDPKKVFKPHTEVIRIGRYHFRLRPKWSG